MKEFFTYLTNYQSEIRKFFVAIGVVLASIVALGADGSITGMEWITIAIEFLGALGVYGVQNKRSSRHGDTAELPIEPNV